MKFFIFIAVVVLGITQLTAQDQPSRIEIAKYGYWYKGRYLDFKEIREITKLNSAAYDELQIARNRNTVRSVLGVPGVALVVWPFVTLVKKGDPNWVLAEWVLV